MPLHFRGDTKSGPVEALKLPRMDYTWTHRKKGGQYRVTSFTAGAGKLHSQTLVHYRRLSAGGVGPVFSRLAEEWHDTMEPIKE